MYEDCVLYFVGYAPLRTAIIVEAWLPRLNITLMKNYKDQFFQFYWCVKHQTHSAFHTAVNSVASGCWIYRVQQRIKFANLRSSSNYPRHCNSALITVSSFSLAQIAQLVCWAQLVPVGLFHQFARKQTGLLIGRYKPYWAGAFNFDKDESPRLAGKHRPYHPRLKHPQDKTSPQDVLPVVEQELAIIPGTWAALIFAVD